MEDKLAETGVRLGTDQMEAHEPPVWYQLHIPPHIGKGILEPKAASSYGIRFHLGTYAHDNPQH